jgi:putative ABC transport system substrate-binding protein
MNRRDTILTLLALCTVIVPLVSFAQQPRKPWRIGYLLPRTRSASLEFYGELMKGMRDLGYSEGRDFVVEARFADGKYDRLPALAAELVALKVDVIVAGGSNAIRAAQKATARIPIVMVTESDPIASGFAQTLARPGGNITGLSNIAVDVSAKQVELLSRVVPKLSVLAVLENPDNPVSAPILKAIGNAAHELRVKILPVMARNAEQIERGFAAMAREHAQALIVVIDPLFNLQQHQIVSLAVRFRVASMFSLEENADAGGLMSYGQNLADLLRATASYVDRILKGASPGDLPIEQPTRFYLSINLKTAKALGITIPPSVLLRADRVIE